MGVLGDVAALLTLAWRVLQDRHEPVRLRPQELFDTYLAPSYAMLKTVHADYLDMYHELNARIYLEDSLSAETVRWFSRTRTLHQAERSELLILDLPGVRSNPEYGNLVERAARRYLWAVRDYLEPRGSKSWDEEGRCPWTGSSRSTRTEARLIFLRYWLHLKPEDRRVLLTEELLRPFRPALDLPTRARMIDELLFAANDQPSGAVALRVERTTTEALKLHVIANSSAGDGSPRENQTPPENLAWRVVLGEHIDEEVWNLQSNIGAVQQAFTRARILTDRASANHTA